MAVKTLDGMSSNNEIGESLILIFCNYIMILAQPWKTHGRRIILAPLLHYSQFSSKPRGIFREKSGTSRHEMASIAW